MKSTVVFLLCTVATSATGSAQPRTLDIGDATITYEFARPRQFNAAILRFLGKVDRKP